MFSRTKHNLRSIRLILLSVFVCTLPFQFVHADDALDDLRSSVSGILDETFRVRENTKIFLDGTEAASSIQRTSHQVNELVFAGDKGWRVRRQLPITEVAREYRKTIQDKDEHLQVMTPTNRGVEPREPISDAIWLEILASPLKLAQQWSLAPTDIKLSRWLSDLRELKAPLKNADGDEISVEVAADKSMKIFLKGSILHDQKTKVKVESSWTLMDIGKITEADLNTSLVRSAS